MNLRYYILFENYEQGLALHDLLDEAGVMNRIAPAPAAARGKLCCGMQGKCRLSQHSGSGKPAAAQTRPVLLIHDEKLKKSPFMAFMTGPEKARIR